MSNQNNSYVPADRNINGQPRFAPMGPVTVNPHAPVPATQYEPIKVPDLRASASYSNATGQPNLGDAVPSSQPSPAIKSGR